jgi:hypothetical protein
MKNSFYLFIVIFSFLIIACNKDDNNLTTNNLTGTKWVSDDKDNSIEFTSVTQLKFIWTDYYLGNKNPMQEDGIYTIDKNNISFDFGNHTMNGIIDGNSITCVWIGETFVVKKQ